jgi:hypothetical protein
VSEKHPARRHVGKRDALPEIGTGHRRIIPLGTSPSAQAPR